MQAQIVDPGCVVTNPVTHAASLPTLAKNARMGHPRLEWRTRKIMRGGPPAWRRFFGGVQMQSDQLGYYIDHGLHDSIQSPVQPPR